MSRVSSEFRVGRNLARKNRSNAASSIEPSMTTEARALPPYSSASSLGRSATVIEPRVNILKLRIYAASSAMVSSPHGSETPRGSAKRERDSGAHGSRATAAGKYDAHAPQGVESKEAAHGSQRPCPQG